MNEQEEKAYIEGQRSAWVSLLRMALKELGYESPESQQSRWVLEREAAIAQLRITCRDFGDNDWPDDLHLADVIDKHLDRRLHEIDDPDRPAS